MPWFSNNFLYLELFTICKNSNKRMSKLGVSLKQCYVG